MTNLQEQEFEGNPVNPTGLIVEVENVDEIGLFGTLFFLGYPLGIHDSVFVDADHWELATQFPEHFVVVGLINPNPSLFRFAGNLRLLDQSLDQILDHTVLVNQYIKSLLIK